MFWLKCATIHDWNEHPKNLLISKKLKFVQIYRNEKILNKELNILKIPQRPMDCLPPEPPRAPPGWACPMVNPETQKCFCYATGTGINGFNQKNR